MGGGGGVVRMRVCVCVCVYIHIHTHTRMRTTNSGHSELRVFPKWAFVLCFPWAKHVIPCISLKAMHLCVNLHFQAVPSYKVAARFHALVSSERTAYKTSLAQLGPVNFNGTPGVIQYLRRLLHRENGLL